SVDDLRIRWVDDHLDGADMFVTKNLLPAAAAVARTIDAALGVGGVKFPDSRDEYGIGVPRVDRNFSDVVSFVEAEVGPGFPGVDRFVDTVAVADGVTKRRFPTANEHDGRIRGCDGNRADRRDRQAVEN